MRCPTCVALLTALAAAGPLAAQPPGASPAAPASVGPRADALVAGFRPGARVRVSVGGTRIEGRAAGTAGDTLLLRVARGFVLQTPVATIDSIWDRRGRATTRGLKTGAVVGGVALGGFALFLTQALCDNAAGCDPGGQELAAVGVVGLAGAVGGALVGAGVGALFPAWRLHWHKPVRGA